MEIQNLDRNESELRTRLIRGLVQQEEQIVRDLAVLGWPCQASGRAGEVHLNAIASDVLALASQELQVFGEALPDLVEKHKSRLKNVNSTEFLNTALGRMNLTCDDQFLNSVGSNDIVEVYNTGMRQVFETSSFCLLAATRFSKSAPFLGTACGHGPSKYWIK